ncbi:hypothetical protein ACLESO_59125, partial [Pyxidicoccus sp. 3LG]
ASSPRERRAVAVAAVFLEDAELLLHASRDDDPAVRAVALRALASLDLLTETEREEAATHEDPWLRAAVLDMESALRACSEDTDPTLRRTALELLRVQARQLASRSGATRAAKPSKRTALTETEDGDHASGETTPPLESSADEAASLLTAILACTHATDPWLRARAAELLSPARSRKELRALLRLSLDSAPMARAAAASSLESCDTLDPLLDDVLHGPTPEADEALRTSAWT